jgi:formylglycine-generating enzyme required for sulfatase activity
MEIGMLRCCLFLILAGALLSVDLRAPAADVDEGALRKAVALYASFDEAVKADFGGGDLTPWTRTTVDAEKKVYAYEKGYDDKALKIAKGKGISGGCLDAGELPVKNGRIYFPAKGNLAFKKGGWGGAVSVWINTDPNKLFKLKFCDPIQITQKGANNGGIWFDFNDAKPRDLRMGVFPAIPEGGVGIKEEDPKAPMVRVKDIGFKSGDWHHVVLNWSNFDTGKKDALATLYIDGKTIGDVKDEAIAMAWDIDRAGIYVAVGYTGLLDELAVFNRTLTADEVAALHKEPGLVGRLVKPRPEPKEPETRPRPEGPLPAEPKFPFDAATAARYQREYAQAMGMPAEFTNSLGMTFVLVPPGTFEMGSPADEPGHGLSGYEETRHTVTLTRPFYLCKHETTVGQFRQFVEAEKYVTDIEKTGGGNAHDEKAVWKHRPGTQWRKPGYAAPFELKDEHPVVHVSHNDARAFCRWLQKRTSTELVYGLPTEAQWEWACRAGSETAYWWGKDEDTTGKVANVGDRALKKVHPDWPRTIMPMDDGHAFLAPVGSYRPNAWGLHDMLGNVWELCATRYGPYGKGPVTNPGDLDPKRGFAVRGGGWSNIAADVRCASRNADPPEFGHSNLGFRVALQLPVLP